MFLILMSIYLPLAFKLGYIRAAGINKFIFLGIFAFGISAGALLKTYGGKLDQLVSPEFKSSVIGFVQGLNPYSVLILVLVIGMLIFIASMRISVRFFNKRELF